MAQNHTMPERHELYVKVATAVRQAEKLYKQHGSQI